MVQPPLRFGWSQKLARRWAFKNLVQVGDKYGLCLQAVQAMALYPKQLPPTNRSFVLHPLPQLARQFAI
jgi:hypothetical protein